MTATTPPPAPTLDLETWAKSYKQDGDGSSSGTQFIDISQDDCGGGPYWVIETERWAFDSLAELIALLRRAGVPDTPPDDRETMPSATEIAP